MSTETSWRILNIEEKVLTRRSNTMGDTLLQKEAATSSQLSEVAPEYMGTRKTKVTLHGVPFVGPLGVFLRPIWEDR